MCAGRSLYSQPRQSMPGSPCPRLVRGPRCFEKLYPPPWGRHPHVLFEYDRTDMPNPKGQPAFSEEEGGYVSTPQGLFTASGVWFQATEEALRDYAGPVLEHVSLAELVRRAERWLRSPMTLAAWALPVLLLSLAPTAAALVTLVLYVGWKLLCPSIVSRRAARLAGWLEQPWLQGLFYVLLLSMLAAQNRFAAVGVGLGGFILLRWGLVERLLRGPLRAVMRRIYALPPEDQVLRGFILRAGLRHGVALPQLDRIREQIARRWNSRPS